MLDAQVDGGDCEYEALTALRARRPTLTVTSNEGGIKDDIRYHETDETKDDENTASYANADDDDDESNLILCSTRGFPDKNPKPYRLGRKHDAWKWKP